MQTNLIITGMTCQNCVRHAREALEGIEGVESVTVDLASGKAEVTHSGANVSALIAAVVEEGYQASVEE